MNNSKTQKEPVAPSGRRQRSTGISLILLAAILLLLGTTVVPESYAAVLWVCAFVALVAAVALFAQEALRRR